MTPLALSLIIVSGLCIIVFPRKLAIAVLLFSITLIPMSAFAIGSASFYPVRILIFFGLVRIIVKGERLSGPIIKTDKLLIFWALVMVIARLLTIRLDTSVISRFGEAYDVIGIYFLYRFLVKDEDDIFLVFKSAALIFCIIVVFMFVERVTQFNMFSNLGGVSPSPMIREGRLRCQGPFAHSILAGTVPATAMAWFVAMYLQGGKLKLYGTAGALASVLMVVLTSSSGPIMSLFFVAVAFAAWPYRSNMKNLRIGIVFTLMLLQLFMKVPVYYLMARIDLTGSSTGWHRAELIDTTFRHFNEWWLAGVDYTRHWMPTGVTWSERHADITNHYIKNGIDGGLAALVLFILVLVSGFSMVGKTLAMVPESNFKQRILVWALGCTLFSHTVTFLSVRYFDQSFSYYYLLLAMIGCLYDHLTNKYQPAGCQATN